MNLRTLTMAIVVLAPVAASAGPLQPSTGLLIDTVTLSSSYETPLTDSSAMGCSLCGVDSTAARGADGSNAYSSSTFGPQFFYDSTFQQKGPASSFWYTALQHGSRGEQSFFFPGNRNDDAPNDNPHPVPEPSTLLLVGSSMAVAAVRKMRAAKKSRTLDAV